MMTKRSLCYAVLLLLTLVAKAAVPGRQSVGLVLSGGGAKGIAHIGVIQALEEHDIPIDYVSGTSMGAIVGGLYACGYSPEEMLRLIESPGFAYWATGRINENLAFYYSKPEPTPVMYSVSLPVHRSTSTDAGLMPVPSSLISSLPMNFAFMELFSGYTAQCGGNFDNLFIPFRCVASDVVEKRKVVLRSGSVGDAIHASMSFPIVFQPTEIDGDMLYDGGIYDNFPVDVMQSEFAPSILIGVDVSTPDKQPSYDMINQLETMIVQKNDNPFPDESGIKIHVDLRQYKLLDFQKAREIYKIGYDCAMEYIDSICGRVAARADSSDVAARRAAFKSHTPSLRFNRITVSGGSRAQNSYMAYLFDRNHADTFGISRVRDAYYHVISSNKIRDLVPHAQYDSITSMFDLNVKAAVKHDMKVGIGGYVTSSTNSMVFLSWDYSTMSFRSLEAGVNAWIGQSYMAGMASGALRLRTGTPSALELQAVLSRQKFYENDNLFFTKNIPRFVTQQEAYARLRYSLGAGRHGKAEAAVGIGSLDDRYYDQGGGEGLVSDKDRCRYTLGQVRLRYEYNTLDQYNYPTAGGFFRTTLYGMLGRYHYRSYVQADGDANEAIRWASLNIDGRKYFAVNNLISIGGELNAVLSTRKLLRNYNAAIVGASAFTPTPSSYNAFNPGFRANSYVAAGVVPIWNVVNRLQLRLSAYAFVPLRRISANTITGESCYGRWFSNPEVMAELATVYSLPFASISAYCNYMSYPAHNWNVGVSFGLFILAPKFMR